MCTTVVARNHLGEVIRIHTARLGFSDVLCGEAAACCLAVSVALELGFKFILVESDSRIVINLSMGQRHIGRLRTMSPFVLSF
uniref:RNase H type-1 domain-containing protein n=1 Tax=Cannabis sativa TaxID=3483 RepID=A0A803Q424_CANSA